ncbi:spermidine synthase [Alicyclobacillus pomorum]|jgi:spermidine synthase|uniref:spermidine synthase n=1 Tax=Alicyclobacillus pomorum TaxID=204470 RepID=UPI0003FDA1A8|nr:hypothetical protein [Alicyclobacillus pomorum]
MPEKIVQKLSGTIHDVVEVVQRGRIRYLRFGRGGGWQGAMYTDGRPQPVFPYQRAFTSLVETADEVSSFLAFGVGSGTALRTVQQVHPKSRLYGLELDERVVDVAIQYFGAPNHRAADYWIGDGVAFLCNTDVTVDLLFVDAYMANQVYGPCLHPDFTAVLHAATTPSGVAVCNVITSFPLRGRVRAFLEAASGRFATTTLLPVGPPLPYAEQNVLCVFSKSPGYLERWRAAMRKSPALYLHERWLWPLRARTFRGSSMV